MNKFRNREAEKGRKEPRVSDPMRDKGGQGMSKDVLNERLLEAANDCRTFRGFAARG